MEDEDFGAPAPPTLMIDPPEINVPAAGGNATHQIGNPSGVRLAFKLKWTNNTEYRLNPVFGFVDAQQATPFEVTRLPGAPKTDTLEVHYKEAPMDCTDAKGLFADGKELGHLTINMNAMAHFDAFQA